MLEKIKRFCLLWFRPGKIIEEMDKRIRFLEVIIKYKGDSIKLSKEDTAWLKEYEWALEAVGVNPPNKECI